MLVYIWMNRTNAWTWRFTRRPNVHNSLPCYVSSPLLECVPEYRSPSGGTSWDNKHTVVSRWQGISVLYPTRNVPLVQVQGWANLVVCVIASLSLGYVPSSIDSPCPPSRQDLSSDKLTPLIYTRRYISCFCPRHFLLFEHTDSWDVQERGKWAAAGRTPLALGRARSEWASAWPHGRGRVNYLFHLPWGKLCTDPVT